MKYTILLIAVALLFCGCSNKASAPELMMRFIIKALQTGDYQMFADSFMDENDIAFFQKRDHLSIEYKEADQEGKAAIDESYEKQMQEQPEIVKSLWDRVLEHGKQEYHIDWKAVEYLRHELGNRTIDKGMPSQLEIYENPFVEFTYQNARYMLVFKGIIKTPAGWVIIGTDFNFTKI
ncbi:MAG: hypothetical protein K8S56_01450 [Candidatus Cloacimonetes bacterium]|nr:hypothetical protein [Candidatus Cloacimonadota bacterium]